MKVVRELGLERRETVWSLSTINKRKMRGLDSSTRGPRKVNQWFTGCLSKALPGRYIHVR